MTSTQQRAALQRQIWQIANDVRGAVDGWDFKQYVLGTLFYRFISENFASYIEADDETIDYARLSERYAEPGDVVITDVGETVEDVGKAVAWLGNEKVAIHDHCYAFRHSMNPKFVSYYMQTTKFIAEKAKYVARTKVNTLLVNSYSKISIPIPSPTEQARIVAILDKFDTLTNSISAGLPREIALRQQQYEYYRDLLFDFPPPLTPP